MTCDTENKKQKTLLFPSSRVAKLKKIKKETGCYKFGGTIKLSREIEANKLQIYIQLSNQPVTSWENNENWLKAKLMDDGSEPKTPAQPRACQDYDDLGCGGYGSCVHCHSCEEHKTVGNVNINNEPSIEVKGKNLNCGHKFTKGKNKGVYLKFCLPTKGDFLRVESIEPKTYNELKNTTRELLNKGMDIFVKIYIFDTDISGIHNSLLKRSHLYRLATRNVVADDKAVPWRLARRMKWNKIVIRDKKGWIGCHYIRGNIMI